MKAVKGRPTNLTGSFTALLSSNAAHAESFNPSPEVLARWYEQQLTAVRGHIAALRAALEEMMDAATVLTRVDDPGWPAYWALDARYQYAEDTLKLLEKEGHVLSCETHGPFGCGAGLTESEATALAFHGYVAGGDRMGWRRPCELCAKGIIDAKAASLLHSHRTGVVQ